MQEPKDVMLLGSAIPGITDPPSSAREFQCCIRNVWQASGHGEGMDYVAPGIEIDQAHAKRAFKPLHYLLASK